MEFGPKNPPYVVLGAKKECANSSPRFTIRWITTWNLPGKARDFECSVPMKKALG
jgi:hypothetical protein